MDTNATPRMKLKFMVKAASEVAALVGADDASCLCSQFF